MILSCWVLFAKIIGDHLGKPSFYHKILLISCCTIFLKKQTIYNCQVFDSVSNFFVLKTFNQSFFKSILSKSEIYASFLLFFFADSVYAALDVDHVVVAFFVAPALVVLFVVSALVYFVFVVSFVVAAVPVVFLYCFCF